MIVSSRFPKALIWGPDYTTIYNDAFRPILGQRQDVMGRSFRDIWADVWPDIEPLVIQAYAGQAVYREDFHLVTSRNGTDADAWFTFCYSPVRSAAGEVIGILDTVTETTDKVIAVRNARLLNQELSHRMKNTLAMIGAVANQTFRNAASVETARRVFSERLAALGEAHSLLTELAWAEAPIGHVVEAALKPHRTDEGRIVAIGPPIMLSSRQALSMALAIHELATNAAKYGALSTAEGRIRINWTVEEGRFQLRWDEQDGPGVMPSDQVGFGTQLLTRILPQNFRGKAKLIYAPDGFAYELAGEIDAGDLALPAEQEVVRLDVAQGHG